ncbi:MAG: PTS sugar transporter subunit IIA [Atopobiaceae bacterium]|nr:PTS sugar transporter subunit IIA [Atopobiaceae bacterium]
MSGFVKAEDVFVNQHASSREEVLRFIAEKAKEIGATDDADAVYNAFLAREEMGETGMTDGFAVPHAKDAAIKKPAVFVFKNETPLEWPSFDEKPVDVAIALLVPDGEAGTTHIKLLSKTAVLLMRDEFKSLLRDSNDQAAIAQAINEGVNEE